MRLFLRVSAFCLVASTLTATAVAQTNLIWNGSAGQDMALPANWLLEADGSVVTDLTGSYNLLVNGTGSTSALLGATAYPATVSSLYIGNIGGTRTSAGEITQSSGTLNVSNDIDIGFGAATGGATSSYTMTGGTLSKTGTGFAVDIGESGGSGQLVMSGSAKFTQVDGWLRVATGTGAAGTLSMSGNSTLSKAGNTFVGDLGGTGLMKLTDNATFTATNLEIGSGGNGTLQMDGHAAGTVSGDLRVGEPGGSGAISVGGTSTLTLKNDVSIGYNGGPGNNGGTGSLTVGADASVIDTSTNYFAVGHGSGSVGTLTTSGTISTGGSAFVGRLSGSGTWNQEAGISTINGDFCMAEGTGTSILNLNGGTLAANKLKIWTAGADATVNFNGGTLKTLTANSDLISVQNVYIKANGATIDTNGLNSTIKVGLQTDGASTGNLTKVGAGVLTLGGPNTYTGTTNVQAGGLAFGTGTTFSTGGAVTMQNGTTLSTVMVSGASTTGVPLTLNRDLVLGASNFVLGVGTSSVGKLTVNNFSALANGNQVVIGWAGRGTLSAGTTTVISYTSESTTNVPSFIPQLDAAGTALMTVNDNHSNAVALVGTAITASTSNIGWKGTATDRNWSTVAGWREGALPTSATPAVFNDVGTGKSVFGYTCTLNVDATVSSLLFNTALPPDGETVGFTIASDGIHGLTLNSTIALDSQIQVVSGSHVVAPAIHMTNGKTLYISGAGTSSLALTSTASDYNGPVDVTSASVTSGYMSGAAITLNKGGSFAYTGTDSKTLAGLTTFTTSGTVTSISSFGSGGAVSIAPQNLVVGSYTALNLVGGTLAVNSSTAGTYSTISGSVYANNGEIVFNSSAPTTINVSSQLGAGKGVGGTNGVLKILGATTVNASGLNIGTDAAGNVGSLELGTAGGTDSPTLYSSSGCYYGANGGSATVVLNNGSYLNQRTWLRAADNGGSATFTLNDSSHARFSSVDLARNGTGGNASWTMSGTSAVTVDGGFNVNAGTDAKSAIAMSGSSTMNIGGTSTSASTIGNAISGSLTFAMSGSSTMNFSGTASVTLGGNASTVTLSNYATINTTGVSGTKSSLNTTLGASGSSTAPSLVTLSGNAAINTTNKIIVGDGGPDSVTTLNMSGDSRITATALSDQSRLGSRGTTNIDMSGTSQINLKSGYQTIGFSGVTTLVMGGTSSINTTAVAQANTNTTTGEIKDNWLRVGSLTGTSTVSVTLNDAAKINATNAQVWVGYGNSATTASTLPGTALLTLSGANSELNATDIGIVVGQRGGNGTLAVNAGSVNAKNLWVGQQHGGNGTEVVMGNANVTVAGTGVVNVTTGSLAIGAVGGSGTYNQNGGVTHSGANPVIVGEYEYAQMGITWPTVSTAGTGTLNLNGGIFEAAQITTHSDATGVITGTSGTINFNGGTLKAMADSTDFIAAGSNSTMTLKVKANGAVIDTNGHAVTIAKALVADSAGGLTKLSAGTLTLAAANTYTGTTTVKAGALKLATAAQANVLSATGACTDIQAGALVFEYDGTTSPANAVKAALKTSYDTTGFKSGRLCTTTGFAAGYTLGWKDDGATLATVTVKIAQFGDTDLSGKVDFDDLSTVLGHYNQAGIWATGDFNYNGLVNFDDLSYCLGKYNQSLPVGFQVDGVNLDAEAINLLTSFGVVVTVPEPGTIALLLPVCLFGYAVARRRRK